MVNTGGLIKIEPFISISVSHFHPLVAFLENFCFQLTTVSLWQRISDHQRRFAIRQHQLDSSLDRLSLANEQSSLSALEFNFTRLERRTFESWKALPQSEICFKFPGLDIRLRAPRSQTRPSLREILSERSWKFRTSKLFAYQMLMELGWNLWNELQTFNSNGFQRSRSNEKLKMNSRRRGNVFPSKNFRWKIWKFQTMDVRGLV